MENRIQLLHPLGKKAISIDKDKYDLIKKHLLSSLKANKTLTHKEILNELIKQFRKNNIKFTGSLEWYTEWVKLDLEARKIILRIPHQKTQQFKIA